MPRHVRGDNLGPVRQVHLADGTGTPFATGHALLNPSAQLTDATDDMIVTKAQLSAKLAGPYPQVRLLATDNTALRLQDGRGRSLSPGRRETHSRSRSSSRPALTLHRDQRQPGRVHCRRQLQCQRQAGCAHRVVAARQLVVRLRPGGVLLGTAAKLKPPFASHWTVRSMRST